MDWNFFFLISTQFYEAVLAYMALGWELKEIAQTPYNILKHLEMPTAILVYLWQLHAEDNSSCILAPFRCHNLHFSPINKDYSFQIEIFA